MKVFVDTAALMEKPLAASRRPRLAGQAHQSRLARVRLLAVSRRHLDDARTAGGRRRGRSLRLLPRLPRRLPDRRISGAVPARCAALHLLSHDRAQGPDPARTAPADGQSHLRLRRLPRGVSVEQVRAGRPRDAKLAARDELRAPKLAELARLDDAAFRALFRKSPVKRIGRDRFVRNVMIAIGNSGDASLAIARPSGCATTRRRSLPKRPHGRSTRLAPLSQH